MFGAVLDNQVYLEYSHEKKSPERLQTKQTNRAVRSGIKRPNSSSFVTALRIFGIRQNVICVCLTAFLKSIFISFCKSMSGDLTTVTQKFNYLF